MTQGISCECGCSQTSYDTVWFEAFSAWRIPDHLNDEERELVSHESESFEYHDGVPQTARKGNL